MPRRAPSPSTDPSSRLKALAAYLGFGSPRGDSARGRAFGVDIQLELQKQQELIARVRVPMALPRPLQLDSRQAPARSPGTEDAREVLVSEPAFDNRVRVMARNPEAVLQLLRDAEVRRRLPLLFEEHPRARLADDELIIPVPSELNRKRGLALVKEVAELAVELARASAFSGTAGPVAPAPPVTQRSKGPASRPRPGAGVHRKSNKRARRVVLRQSFLWRRWGTIALRVAVFPCTALVCMAAYTLGAGVDLLVQLSLLLALGSVMASLPLWRCPACHRSLNEPERFFLGPLYLRSCPSCFVILDARD